MRRFWIPTIVTITLLLDQTSKAWARGLGEARHPVIDGFWDWKLAANDGVAFSMFSGGGGRVILSIIAAAAVIALSYFAWRDRRASYALLAGGALGNLVDRVYAGSVTDFVSWHVGSHYWPLFNVADVALVVGVALLLLRRDRSTVKPCEPSSSSASPSP